MDGSLDDLNGVRNAGGAEGDWAFVKRQEAASGQTETYCGNAAGLARRRRLLPPPVLWAIV